MTNVAPPSPEAVVRELFARLDAARFDEVAELLADDFECAYPYDGERFDRDGWVRLNAEYPVTGLSLDVDELVADGDRVAVLVHVHGEGGSWRLASFATVREGLLTGLREVWVDDQPPPDRRPA